MVQLFSRLWVAFLVGMRLDFIVIMPLLQFHCGFFFIFGGRASFLVCSGVFYWSVVIQQLVVILVFS